MASHGVPRTSGAPTEEQRQRDAVKIEQYRQLEDRIRTQVAAGTYDCTLFELTTAILRRNPEYYTIWNVRRRCLTSSLLSQASGRSQSQAEGKTIVDNGLASDLEVVKMELKFTVPLLMAFPKCYWVWNFRQWVLSQAIRRLDVPVARDVWETELGLISKMLDKDQRNFHAWGYRRLVVARLESAELQGKSMAEDEFAYTTKMIRRNLSNFSAWHNRSQIMPRLLQERGATPEARLDFLVHELDLVREGLDVGPEDQSLWYYHQFLVSQVLDDGHGQTAGLALDAREKAARLRHEIEQIKDLLDDYGSVKWIYMALLEYTLALERLGQGSRSGDAAGDLRTWLSKLRELDPMRTGRWNDLERLVEP